jgi:hypothetical protein
MFTVPLKGLIRLILGFALVAVLGYPAAAATCLSVSAPDADKAGGADLVLNGQGIRKATMLNVKVYVASFYLPAKTGDAAKILAADQSWKLVLSFVRGVGASDMREAFDEGFGKTAGDKAAALKDRIKTLKDSMQDYDEGHYLAFAYDPASGVQVDINGKAGPLIPGADFAASLLAIWIGKDPPNPDIKKGMLGGKCD